MSKENSDNDFIDWLDDENQKTTYNYPADFTQEKVDKTQKELKKLSSIDAKIRYLRLEVIAFKQFWFELGVTMKMFKKEADPFYSWLKWCKEEIKRLELVKMDQAEEGTQKSKADQKIPEASEILSTELNKYGFFELDKIKEFPKTTKLVELLRGSVLPYQIAMLDQLGFIDFLIKEHCKTKRKAASLLSKIIGKNDRDIRGNIDCLSEVSGERERGVYKSHEFKEIVKEDLKKLK